MHTIAIVTLGCVEMDATVPLQPHLRSKLEKLLSTVDDQGLSGTRLNSDATRLSRRIRKFIEMNLIGPDTDFDALELACYALQLPPRQARAGATGKVTRPNLRDRCEQAAELLVSMMGDDIDEKLLDRSTRLLHEVPHRAPVIDEARLLADALNLEDFGVTGLIIQTVQLAIQGEGVADLSVALDKREQYGYWDARLKDGFHFPQIRALAAKRLESARKVAKMLADELADDQP